MKQFFLILLPIFLWSCAQAPVEKPLIVREDPGQGAATAKLILENTPVQLADGLSISLWASDSLAPDPIALSIDDFNRVYLTSTNRQKNSEFDIRGHRDWMIPSISFQSVEDRRAFLRKTFDSTRSQENEWLPDLNHDGIHDWRDLTVEKDEVWRLEDLNGDGRAELSTRIVHDFNTEVTDVAEGLLVRENDMFVAIAPDLWRLQDIDGDGVPEKKESISTGYQAHIGFGGHGMSGIVEGPDGKIYWGIGDIGANITDKAGNKHVYPNEGIIVRSNPDGTDFEVFASGLRNTYEFTFDEYGNLITSDNDGDHPGESERLVHIVEGTDLGWRANWQYGKYVDPKNNRYNVWMDEKFSIPRWEGQAAHIIPPILNYHNGPTGMVYNPGHGLGKKWQSRFFLVEFVGTPSRSHIWSFTLKLKGASFELNDEIDMLSGILPTGIQFGPDGAMYVADWINGWGTKNYGRVWKLDVSGTSDLAAERQETQRLMQLKYNKQSINDLQTWLGYPDMRIRKKAQFELAKRGKDGVTAFQAAIAQRENQLARVHAIWGMGQLAEQDSQQANSLLDLLNDADAEIVTQAAKVLGDRRYVAAAEKLMGLLDEKQSPRVRFYAAQALGRMKHKPAIPALIKMIDANNDADLYIRHAGVVALSRIGAVDSIVELTKSTERDLRVASALVLRRMKSEKISLLLTDPDEYIVTEAARAINDDLSIVKSLPDLAATIQDKRFTGEPLLRRAINACLRVGGEKELDMLIAFARRTDVAPAVRAEALAALGTWPDLSVLDRVDGYYRGEVKRDPTSVRQKMSLVAKEFLHDKNPIVVMAAGEMLTNLNMSAFNGSLAQLAQSHTSENVRASLIKNLQTLKYNDMPGLIETGMNDRSEKVRSMAISLIGELNISKEALPDMVKPIFYKGSIGEHQALIKVLGKMPVEKSELMLSRVIDLLKEKKLSDAIRLELSEAVEASQSKTLKDKFASLPKANSILDEYAGTLLGGNGGNGWGIFFYNSTAQCVRCHAIDGEGGKVGPDLSHIGKTLSREQMVEAIVDPSARLAPGFGAVKVSLTDGSEVVGTLMEENAKEIILKTSDAEPLEIELSRISKRQNYPSGMPPMGKALSKKEIRDLVEFLASKK
jgi:quinoprotein glucose dehydrogenase